MKRNRSIEEIEKVIDKVSAGKKANTQKMDGYLRFILFLLVIGLAYNWNSHYAEKLVRKRDTLKKEVKELKSTYLMKEAMMGAGTKYSEIDTKVDTMGLSKAITPPYKIIVEKQSK